MCVLVVCQFEAGAIPIASPDVSKTTDNIVTNGTLSPFILFNFSFKSLNPALKSMIHSVLLKQNVFLLNRKLYWLPLLNLTFCIRLV